MSDHRAAISEKIHQIAGKNAVSVNDESVRRLCCCVQYFVTQISILDSEDLQLSREAVLRNALEILDGTE